MNAFLLWFIRPFAEFLGAIVTALLAGAVVYAALSWQAWRARKRKS